MRKFFKFSTKVIKTYDLITIGSYANQIPKIMSQICFSQKLKMLSIEHRNSVVQPSLFLRRREQVPLSKKLSQFSDVELGVMVDKIIPNENIVVLKNQNKYKYKQLIYSGSEFEWLNTNFLLNQFVDQPLKYSDFDFQNNRSLYQRNFGTIVFLIPDQKHFGYENYFMVHLKKIIQKKNSYKEVPLKIKILNQGNSFFPFSERQNRSFEFFLKSNHIEAIKNCEFQAVDTKNKTIYFKNQKLKYDGFLYYTPLKVPDLLREAQIDPFQINQATLNHSVYENIHIIGNVLPNSFSFHHKKKMIETISYNVLFKLQKIHKQIHFEDNNLSKSLAMKNTSRNIWKSLFFLKVEEIQAMLKYHRINWYFNYPYFQALSHRKNERNAVQYNPNLCPTICPQN